MEVKDQSKIPSSQTDSQLNIIQKLNENRHVIVPIIAGILFLIFLVFQVVGTIHLLPKQKEVYRETLKERDFSDGEIDAMMPTFEQTRYVSILFSYLYLVIFFTVFLVVSQWQIFKKAGKPGWASLVPIYNTIVLLQIAGKPWYWFFFLLIPFVNIVFVFLINDSLAKKFGKSSGFGVGMTLLAFIFYPMLASDKTKYLELPERAAGGPKISKLGVLLSSLLIYLFIFLPFQVISSTIGALILKSYSSDIQSEIPAWSNWVIIFSNILFFILAIMIWKMKKMAVCSFVGLGVLLSVFYVWVGYEFLFSLNSLMIPMMLLLFAWINWNNFE